jgi:hypothetical protein
VIKGPITARSLIDGTLIWEYTEDGHRVSKTYKERVDGEPESAIILLTREVLGVTDETPIKVKWR